MLPLLDTEKSSPTFLSSIETKLSFLRKFYFTEMVSIFLVIGMLAVFFTSHASETTRVKPILYQGRLTNADYVPVTDGARRMRFRIYDNLTDGSCKWGTGAGSISGNCTSPSSDSTTIPVTVTRGVFSVSLGSGPVAPTDTNNPALAYDFSDSTVYLGIMVCNNEPGVACDESDYEPLAPRTLLGATPYALNAQEVAGSVGSLYSKATGFVIEANSTTLTTGQILSVSFPDGLPTFSTPSFAGMLVNLGGTMTQNGKTLIGQYIILPQANHTGSTNGYIGQYIGVNGAGNVVYNPAGPSSSPEYWIGTQINTPNINGDQIVSKGIAIYGGTVTAGTPYAFTSDQAAGSVGIGTAVPSATLDVVGSVSQKLSGTVTATPTSQTVTGIGTFFNSEIEVGDIIRIGSFPAGMFPIIYKVASIENNTSLTLTSSYMNASGNPDSGVIAFRDPGYLFSVSNGNNEVALNVSDKGYVGIGRLGGVAPSAYLEVKNTSTDHTTALNLMRTVVNYSDTDMPDILLLAQRVIAAGAGTTTISQPMATFADNCAETGGTCVSAVDTVQINQQSLQNSGAALNITSAGTGLALRVNGDGTLTDTTPFVIDSSGRLGIGTATPYTSALAELILTPLVSDTAFGVYMDGPSGTDPGITGEGLLITSNIGYGGRLLGLFGRANATEGGAVQAQFDSNLTVETSGIGATASNLLLDLTNNNTTNPNTVYGIKSTITDNVALANVQYGGYFAITAGGDTATTKTAYGLSASATNQNTTNQGARTTYGGNFSAIGSANGTSNTYGIYAVAAAADSNYAVYAAASGPPGSSAYGVYIASGALHIASQSTPSAPADGDVWYDSTQKTLLAYINNIQQSLSGTIYTAYGSDTIALSTSEESLLDGVSSIGSLTLPANFFTPGKTLRIKAAGHYKGTGAGTFQLKLKIGDAFVLGNASSNVIPSTAGNSNVWDFETTITEVTVGEFMTATHYPRGRITHNTDQTTVQSWQFPSSPASPFSFDTTLASTINLTGQFGNSTINTITLTNFTVEVLN